MRYKFKKYLNKRLYKDAYSRASFSLAGTVLQEIQVAYAQFYTFHYPIRSFINTTSIIISSLLRVYFGRSLKFSYAHTGEDRIIEGILKPIINKPGVYVDVGCNHPKFLSNTYGLYKKGWRGICIDANAKLIKHYRLLRPKDIAVVGLVSDSIKQEEFFQIENNLLSTVDKSNLEEAINLDLDYEVLFLETVTLTSILKEYNVPKHFELLTIDAEEHDFAVLSSMDFNLFRPKLIVVEDETLNFLNVEINQFVRFLRSKKYELVGSVLKNLYFTSINIDQEQA